MALNYLICQGSVLPIPGAKSAAQAEEFAGALGWSLTAEEVAVLQAEVRKFRAAVNDSSLPAKVVNDLLMAAQL